MQNYSVQRHDYFIQHKVSENVGVTEKKSHLYDLLYVVYREPSHLFIWHTL